MRNYAATVQNLERQARIIHRNINKWGVPKKRLPLAAGHDKHLTVRGFVPNLNAKLPTHLKSLRKRGHADQLRAAYALGIMIGIMIGMGKAKQPGKK